MIRSILVPTDGSAAAEHAIDYAAGLAVQTRAALVFCFALDKEALIEEAASVGSMNLPELIDAERRTGENVLSRAVAHARERHVACDRKLTEGRPVDVILQLAKELGPDIIVMGTHGRRGLSRLLLGSTTEAVLRRSAIPVVAVPLPRPASQQTAAPAPAAAVAGELVSAPYPDEGTANAAIERLLAAGYERGEIALIADPGRCDIDFDQLSKHVGRGTLEGGATGTAVGALLGVAANVAGILVAGPLPIVAGAVSGLLIGSLDGALISAGMPPDEARACRGEIAAGRILVGAYAPAGDADRVRALLQAGAVEPATAR